ncbi:hypothetical protein D3C86_1765060 [compost metagenome]
MNASEFFTKVTLRVKKWRKRMAMSWYGLPCCSCGSSMFRPTLADLPACAPLLAASMMPGPPPEITAKPASENSRAISMVFW